MTREEFYKLTDILSTDVLGNFMHGGEADELIAMFEEVVEHSNILEQEEPVSDDLEEAADNALSNVLNTHEIVNVRSCLEMFRFGAKWQKEKDESTTEDLGEYINELSKQFPEVSFAKLSRIAVRVAKWQNEQMMAKAIYAVVSQVPCANEIILRNPESVHWFYLPQEMNKLGLNKGDKVKLVIIKED